MSRRAAAFCAVLALGAVSLLIAYGYGTAKSAEIPFPPPAVPAPPAPVTPASPPSPAENHTPTITATLTAVSLSDAKPLPGMIPIITLEPNAFDEPLAHGDPTDANGVGTFVFPADRKVCLRVWDPTLEYFPNNYFDVLPSEEDSATEGTIVMARAASLHALLLRPDGTPAAGETVRLMMFHPKRGPWWPSEAKTDGGGAVAFDRVPPGCLPCSWKAPPAACVWRMSPCSPASPAISARSPS